MLLSAVSVLFVAHSSSEIPEGFMNNPVLSCMKYAYDLVLLAREETMLQGIIDRLIEVGRCYGMEMYVEKTRVMRISRQYRLW